MKFKNLLILTTAMLFSAQAISAATIRGKVLDKTTGEPLLGATVIVKGTTNGTATSFDGSFEIHAKKEDQLVISYISYLTQELVADRGADDLTISLAPDTQMLASVEVVTRASKETEAILQNERMASHVAIENLGVREMSLKGLSNAEDGVKKMTGISIADAGQIIVRGLGDRYSITTLNGQPIASPNPDNKLIPLDIFPSSAIQNITVSKVYDAVQYADYSGAHIDISTKNIVTKNFFNVTATIKGNTNTTFQDFYRMDNVSLLSQSEVDPLALSLSKTDYASYVKSKDIFDTGFDVDQNKAPIGLSATVGWGHIYNIGAQKLSIIATGAVDNDYQTIIGGEERRLEASTGDSYGDFTYDSYERELKMAALFNAGLSLRDKDHVSYTMFYARNANEEYKLRSGIDEEDDSTVTSNGITHIYKMLTNQFAGTHYLGEDDAFTIDWRGSYSLTNSDEPDRRQVRFYGADNLLDLGTQDTKTTYRYFGYLEENELNGQLALSYNIDDSKVTFGVAYKDKQRDFSTTSFEYNFSGLDTPIMSDPYSVDQYLGFPNIENGDITISRYMPSSNTYEAYNNIVSTFVAYDYVPSESWLINVGLRYEMSEQSVDYNDDAGVAKNRTLESNDLFPALNVKYNIAEKSSVRLAASRTVTRPSFVEMAPFKYQESLGAGIVRGNDEIENGYNYNIDLRYEKFFKGGDMYSITGYYKQLDSPIERVQTLSGNTLITTFENAEGGMAAGVEFEVKKALVKDFRVSVNGSYMLTDVNLSEGGNYTNSERALQGASPYLFNADFTYLMRLADSEKYINFALLYNLQGPRIDQVGMFGLGDVVQRSVHDLSFVVAYKMSEKLEFKAELSNLANLDVVFDQEVFIRDTDGNLTDSYEKVVQRYNTGIDAKIGLSIKF